ncbi:MAG TPA: glycosyltransferase [Pyrinomonadaceae bacterium]|jgi:glycosyltransferase involved in cell wall biosynthesis|nr:glycosyltransferase [Pyrinomonadaceae bacterium]
MKIVRIIARLNVGGPARHVVWLTAGLPPEDYETVLVAGVVPQGEDDMGYFARAAGVRPLIIPHMSREISPKDALTVWKLYRLFRRERPDLVHTHTAKAGTVGRLAGVLYRSLTPASLIGRPRPCRFVHTYHGHIFHSYYGPLKTRLFLLIEKMLARFATDRIIVISAQQYKEIHERFGVGRVGQFAVIPLGLDLSIFADWSSRRRALRDELCAGDADVLVGIVGRLTEIKNHALFLEAAARYRESQGGARNANGRRVRFIIIGDGNLRGGLEAQVRALSLSDDVTFLGTRDDPQNFYPALDIVALTSLNEGTPLTLIEAMANQRATIATAVGGVPDLLGELIGGPVIGGPVNAATASKGGAGFKLCERGVLVQPNDAEAFCEGLTRLIEDEGLRHQMGARGRHFVTRNYSRERLLKDISNLYREMSQPETKTESGIWSLESRVKGRTKV